MVEIVGCSTAHPSKARPMPDRPSITKVILPSEAGGCSVPGCGAKTRAGGMCRPHYDQSRYVPVERHCPMCGPFLASWSPSPICPSCDMTAGEHAYRLRIMADSAAVYAQEVREFNAKRRNGKP